jgi:hypothetical protein
MRRAAVSKALCAAALALLTGCSGSSVPLIPPASPSPTAVTTAPPVTVSCPLGTLESQCDGHQAHTFLPDLNAAMDRLIAKRPELFDLKNSKGGGVYGIKRLKDYLDGLVAELGAAGLCAESFDLQTVKIKSGNDYSERYNVVTDYGYVRRDDKAYLETCRPAIFPVNPADYIDRVRVGFYRYECLDGRVWPPFDDFQMPMACTAYVTATPKDKNFVSVPAVVHGNEIEWELLDGAGVVGIRPDPTGEKFNLVLEPIKLGHVYLCATVLGKRGCMTADVVP